MAFSTASPIAATSADADFSTIFVVRDDGAVYTASWNGERGWSNNFARAGPEAINPGDPEGSLGVLAAGTPIGATAYATFDGLGDSEDYLDWIFAVGVDGQVWSRGSLPLGFPHFTDLTDDPTESYWRQGWSAPWAPVGVGTFAPRTPVAAVVRNITGLFASDADIPNVDLFAVGMDGSVYTAWSLHPFYGTDTIFPYRFGGWKPVGTGTFAQLTPIAAIADADNDQDGNLDLFAVGEDGRVYSAWWRGNAWEGWLPVGIGTFSQLTPVTGTRRDDDLDLFAVGKDGRVYSAWWRGDGWQGWGPVGSGEFSQLTRVAVVARGDDASLLDLFAIGLDGSVYTAWWRGDGWNGWTSFGNPSIGRPYPAMKSVAAVGRDKAIDVFGVAGDGVVYWTTWNENDGWRVWDALVLPLSG